MAQRRNFARGAPSGQRDGNGHVVVLPLGAGCFRGEQFFDEGPVAWQVVCDAEIPGFEKNPKV